MDHFIIICILFYKKDLDNVLIRLNLQKSPESTENFDSQFRKLSIKMSACDIDILRNLEGYEFPDFDYINPYWPTWNTHDESA